MSTYVLCSSPIHVGLRIVYKIKNTMFVLSFQLTGNDKDQQVLLVLAENVFSLKKLKQMQPPQLRTGKLQKFNLNWLTEQR